MGPEDGLNKKKFIKIASEIKSARVTQKSRTDRQTHRQTHRQTRFGEIFYPRLLGPQTSDLDEILHASPYPDAEGLCKARCGFVLYFYHNFG